ncbi:MAG: hypothetical protein J0H69_23845 [Burkholderiales bacterium]|jgi:hypothetical protein|nr:hypothetical protein [Burkholderiales bacterium]
MLRVQHHDSGFPCGRRHRFKSNFRAKGRWPRAERFYSVMFLVAASMPCPAEARRVLRAPTRGATMSMTMHGHAARLASARRDGAMCKSRAVPAFSA